MDKLFRYNQQSEDIKSFKVFLSYNDISVLEALILDINERNDTRLKNKMGKFYIFQSKVAKLNSAEANSLFLQAWYHRFN